MTCVKCHVDQGSEAFRLNARGTKPRTDCRDCERTASRERNRARAAELRAYSRTYYGAHREERRAYGRQRRAERGPYRLSDAQMRRKLDSDNARRRAMSPEQREARRARWASYFVGAAHRRRARLRAARIEPVSLERVLERDGATCYLCARALARSEVTFDHVVPLARGGAHAEWNLRVACGPCNSHKGTRLLEELVA